MEKMTVAYFSMEYAIDQSLKIYSGGLGFLSGSHLRGAYELKKDLIGIGILYTNGYYDQERNQDGFAEVKFKRKEYDFLKDLNIVFPISVHNSIVWVKAFLLEPSTFNAAPLYLLTTDIPENDYLSRSICFRLYDFNLATKIAQSILLGIGGGKLLDILNIQPAVYHLNEGHGLPLIFHLYTKYNSIDEVKKRLVFTTHTPESAGNDVVPLQILNEMSFFNGIPLDQIRKICKTQHDVLNYTLTALRFSKISNAVSKIHQKVSLEMWSKEEGICEIISITNSQNATYWTDKYLKEYLNAGNFELLQKRKKELKKELLDEVANQTGKLFNLNTLTIVWSRRITGYKRMSLIFRDLQRLLSLLNSVDMPIQLIIAGKPYPEDNEGYSQLNRTIALTKSIKGVAVLTGYELKLSAQLKKGADVWLNTPRYGREASGTSGMTAAMNGTINFSVADGWFPEFSKHFQNSFVIEPSFSENYDERDYQDYQTMMDILENQIIPTYYKDNNRWNEIMIECMKNCVPAFDSSRMINEYYQNLYQL